MFFVSGKHCWKARRTLFCYLSSQDQVPFQLDDDYACYSFVSCLSLFGVLCLMLSMSLDCPFFVTTSIFFNVYLYQHIQLSQVCTIQAHWNNIPDWDSILTSTPIWKWINISFVTCFRILLMIHLNNLFIFMLVLYYWIT